MQDLLLVFAVPLAVSLVMTRVMRSLALRYGAFDCPDGQRKLHRQPVPVWGGAAVFLALCVGVYTACKMPVAYGDSVAGLASILLLSAGVIFVLGFLDDRFDLRGRFKLLMQFVGVAPIVLAGYWYDQIVLFNHTFSIGWLGVAFTMFWLVGAINALNLLDGMDGNASTIGVIACAAIAAIANRHGLEDVVLISVAMCGAILGFLVYNLPSASIYLGDAGSTVIGLVVGFLSLQGAREPTSDALRVAAPLVVLTVPILDSTLAIVRRKLAGRRFDHADRGHIHHRLQDRGFNAWQSLAIMGVLCLVSAAAAIASTYLESEPLAWLTAAILVVLLAQSRYFGHHEFALGRRAFSALRGDWRQRLTMRAHRVRWRARARLPRWTLDEAWQSLVSAVTRWPVDQLEFCLWNDERPALERQWRRGEPLIEQGNRWRLVLTFGPRRGVRCELVVNGLDRHSLEPRYLSQLASILRVYGRYWLHHPESLLTHADNASVSRALLTVEEDSPEPRRAA